MITGAKEADSGVSAVCWAARVRLASRFASPTTFDIRDHRLFLIYGQCGSSAVEQSCQYARVFI